MPLPRSRIACGRRHIPQFPKDMTRLVSPARRFPAGVDQQFDDTESESRELIRLALRGHMFEAWAREIQNSKLIEKDMP